MSVELGCVVDMMALPRGPNTPVRRLGRPQDRSRHNFRCSLGFLLALGAAAVSLSTVGLVYLLGKQKGHDGPLGHLRRSSVSLGSNPDVSGDAVIATSGPEPHGEHPSAGGKQVIDLTQLPVRNLPAAPRGNAEHASSTGAPQSSPPG